MEGKKTAKPYHSIPELVFTAIESKVYFSATNFCKECSIDESVIMEYVSKAAPRMYDLLKKRANIEKQDVCKKLGEDYWITKELVFDFVAHISPEMCLYLSNSLNNLHRVGVTYTQNYVAKLASSHLSKENMLKLAK